jgi:hypothetical protein
LTLIMHLSFCSQKFKTPTLVTVFGKGYKKSLVALTKIFPPKTKVQLQRRGTPHTRNLARVTTLVEFD